MPVNGYLLFASHVFDEIPIQFYASESEAVAAARVLKPPLDNPLGTADCGNFLGARVLRFRNGKPVGTATSIKLPERHLASNGRWKLVKSNVAQ
jgi:hypothetical protein